MWKEQALLKLSSQKTYHRDELFRVFQSEHESLNDCTFRWMLYNLQNEQKLFRTGYDAYSVVPPEVLPIYRPLYSDNAKSVEELLTERFPELEFVIFESALLNEFLNHQIAQNTIFVQVQKDVSAFACDRLQDFYAGRVLYKPGEKEWDHYWTRGCVIVLDLISQAPLSSEYPHEMTAEKLLVDIVAEKNIAKTFSPSETPQIYESLLESYHVDIRRMNRYAGRRGKSALIKKYTEGRE